jgi:hypothetical protein
MLKFVTFVMRSSAANIVCTTFVGAEISLLLTKGQCSKIVLP